MKLKLIFVDMCMCLYYVSCKTGIKYLFLFPNSKLLLISQGIQEDSVKQKVYFAVIHKLCLSAIIGWCHLMEKIVRFFGFHFVICHYRITIRLYVLNSLTIVTERHELQVLYIFSLTKDYFRLVFALLFSKPEHAGPRSIPFFRPSYV